MHRLLKLKLMETKLTFEEELAVSSAVSLRIHDLSQVIDDCRPLGLDTSVLKEVRDTLLVAYRKLTGIEFNCVYYD